MRALLARYFERMKAIVERHGGTVEKLIGDALMAVFGVPQVHEDDALRAVRAACEMRDALPEFGVQARIGINSGEVVTGTEERLVTGDPVNVAARLEQAARPGDVLLGRETFALVHDAVEVEGLAPLALKGKAEPAPAFRLVSVHEASERRHETATWYLRGPEGSWTTPGGDLDPAVVSSLAKQAGDTPKWDDFDVMTLVRGWVSGQYPNDACCSRSRTRASRPARP